MIQTWHTTRRIAPKHAAGEQNKGGKDTSTAQARRIERAMNVPLSAAHCAEVLPHCAEHAETMRHNDVEATLQGMILDLETMQETTDRKPCVTHCGTDAQDSAKGIAMNDNTQHEEGATLEALQALFPDCYFVEETRHVWVEGARERRNISGWWGEGFEFLEGWGLMLTSPDPSKYPAFFIGRTLREAIANVKAYKEAQA
jgi:hypothetical protein